VVVHKGVRERDKPTVDICGHADGENTRKLGRLLGMTLMYYIIVCQYCLSPSLLLNNFLKRIIHSMYQYCISLIWLPRMGPEHPISPCDLVHSLPSLLLFFYFFPFSFSHSLYLFSFVHPFPFFYESSPTPFPGWRS